MDIQIKLSPNNEILQQYSSKDWQFFKDITGVDINIALQQDENFSIVQEAQLYESILLKLNQEKVVNFNYKKTQHTSDQLHRLLNSLKRLQNLKVLKLDIETIIIKQNTFEQLGQCLSQLKNINILNIRLINIYKDTTQDNRPQDLFNYLQNLPVLKQLTIQIQNSSFQQQCVTELGNSISQLKQIEFLSLDHFSSTLQDLTKITKGIGQLEKLKEFTYSYIEQYPKFKINGFSNLGQSLSQINKLTNLSLIFQSCHIPNTDILLLMCHIGNIKQNSELVSVKELGVSLQNLQNIKQLQLEISSQQSLVEGMNDLKKGLESQKELKNLKIDMRNIKCDSLDDIIKGIFNLNQLQILSLAFSHTTNENHNTIGNSISNLNCLETFSLVICDALGNQLKDSAEGISKMTQLKNLYIDLIGCLEVNDVDEFGKQLQQMPQLQQLRLYFNQLPCLKIVDEIKKSIPFLINLEDLEIKFKSTSVPNKQYLGIINQFSKLPKLIHINSTFQVNKKADKAKIKLDLN